MKTKILLFFFLGLLPLIANSETMNGNELLQKLEAQSPDGLYYVVGIIDAAEASRNVFKTNIMKLDQKSNNDALQAIGKFWGCRPEKASYGQVIDITKAYLKKHPESRHYESVMLIAFAIKEAWPCQN